MSMRLDKYLQVARVLKKRTAAKEFADQDRIFVNERVAKPSTEVNEQDYIKIIFGHHILTIKVLVLQKQVSKKDAALMFEIIDDIKVEAKP